MSTEDNLFTSGHLYNAVDGELRAALKDLSQRTGVAQTVFLRAGLRWVLDQCASHNEYGLPEQIRPWAGNDRRTGR